jgi:hypothetical protein
MCRCRHRRSTIRPLAVVSLQVIGEGLLRLYPRIPLLLEALLQFLRIPSCCRRQIRRSLLVSGQALAYPVIQLCCRLSSRRRHLMAESSRRRPKVGGGTLPGRDGDTFLLKVISHSLHRSLKFNGHHPFDAGDAL